MRNWIAGLCLAVCGPLVQAAPGDSFLMQIPNINGNSTIPGFTGWIGLNSFSAGFTNSVSNSGGGGGVGKLVCSDVMAIKPLDTTSPELVELVANGRHIPTITLVALSGRGDGPRRREFLRLRLTNVMITSVLFGGESAWASRSESVSVTAEQIEVVATPQLPDGSAGAPVSTLVDCRR